MGERDEDVINEVEESRAAEGHTIVAEEERGMERPQRDRLVPAT